MRLFDRPIEALCDPARRRRTMALVAIGYALAWWVYAIVAKSSQDMNADMAEMVVWAHEPALGYSKHPPFLAWVLALWFAVFPHADWAYWLLSAVTLGAGLGIAFALAGEWMEGEKRAVAPFLLAAIPFYNFLGLKFDQNSALIPLWGLAMLGMVRALKSPHAGWAALAGLAAAAAVLTKYWSVFLVFALALTALCDQRRASYFRSRAPWVTALVFLAAVAPHAVWLVKENFPPFAWVADRRASASVWDWLRALGEYAGGTVAYAGPALLLVLGYVRPSFPAVRDSWLPWDGRRAAAVMFWAPMLLPVLAAIPARTNLLSLWNTPALGLLPVMMLASPLVAVTRTAAVRIAATVTGVTLVIVALSPLVAFALLKSGVENDAAYARLVAQAAEQDWRAATDRPLKIIGGPFVLVSTAAFYLDDRPTTFAHFSRYLSPGVDAARIARDGIALMCPADDAWCRRNMDELAARGPPGRRREVTVARRWLGFESPPARFVIAIVPAAGR